MKVKIFKQKLSRVFDDDLSTYVWKNVVDYVVIFFIALSTIQVFLSTYRSIAIRYADVLQWIDYITIGFFTVEVSLRIWCCSEVDPKYKGFWGKVRYCFSFYGMVDILATYPFYLNLLFPIPYSALKILRITRLFRVFRYTKSFDILREAFASKKQEMWISLQFLCIITFILSLFLYFVESEVQPQVFNDGFKSVVWAFAQYIGDPGNFADFSPITLVGRIIACIIGVLGIAIFAVPAGLIGSSFIEVIDEKDHSKRIQDNTERIKKAFRSKRCRITNFQIIPRYISIQTLQAKLSLTQAEVFDVARTCDNIRVSNLATTMSLSLNPQDKLVLEYFPLNRSYGYCIDRGSSVTIVATSSYAEVSLGHFSYYLAKIGGFNYVTRELNTLPDEPFSYYICNPKYKERPDFMEFLSDIKSLGKGADTWTIFILSSSGNDDPIYPNNFHFVYGVEKGNESFDNQRISLHDISAFRTVRDSLQQTIKEKYDRGSDSQLFCQGEKSIVWNIHDNDNSPNVFTLRIAWEVTCWDDRCYEIARDIAQSFNENFEKQRPKGLDENAMKAVGYEYDV